MAKSSGGTRNSGASTGGVVAAPINAGYLASETSFKYTYNPDTVKFTIESPGREHGLESDITASDLRTRSDFAFGSVQRDNDGKFDLGRPDHWFTENMTFSQAVNRAVNEIKTGYRNNENVRDHYMVVESEGTGLWATIRAVLDSNNKVRISISRYKGL